MLSCQHNRISDKAMPVFFHFGNFSGLIFRAAIVVNDSNATTQLRDKTLFNQLNFEKNRESLNFTATEMAISDSVTVSIGEATSGAFRVIFFVRADVRSYIIAKSLEGVDYSD
jgi:hypothetical protein